MKYFLPIIVVVLLASLSTESNAQISFNPETCTPKVFHDEVYIVPAGKMFVITFLTGSVSSRNSSNEILEYVSGPDDMRNVHIPFPAGYRIAVANNGSVYGYEIDLGTYGVTSGDPDQGTSDCQEADSDNDGQVTISDLLLLLGVFGEAC